MIPFIHPPVVAVVVIEEHGYTHDLMVKGRDVNKVREEAEYIADLAATLDDPNDVLPFIAMLDTPEVSWDSDVERDAVLSQATVIHHIRPGSDD